MEARRKALGNDQKKKVNSDDDDDDDAESDDWDGSGSDKSD